MHAPRIASSKVIGPALLAWAVAGSGCVANDASPSFDETTSLYALVQTIDGMHFYPPLGPEPAPTGPFDATLLDRLRVVLEAEDGTGEVSTVGSFSASTRPGLVLLGPHELYWMNVPAATYFTDPRLAYRFRALLDGREVGRSDMSSKVFEVMRYVPTLPVGVKLRLERRDAPVIGALAPARVARDGGALLLTIGGAGFASDSVVTFAGQVVTGTKVSSSELVANIPGPSVASPGTYDVVVSTPSPGGGTSAALALEVYDPVPVLTSVSPAAAVAEAREVTLTIDGDRFVEGSVVRFGDGALATTFVSRSRLTAVLPSTGLALAGDYPVSVLNPSGTTSAAVDFTISNPAPVLSSIAPAGLLIGDAPSLTASGSGFTPQSGLSLDGAPLATTFISATALSAALPSGLSPGTHALAVTNPSPGGGTSGTATLTVNNVVPTLVSLSPSSAISGGAALTMTITGTGFASGATVVFNATSLATTYVSATVLTAAVPPSSLATAGLFNVTVTNPSPTAGGSSARTFTVNDPSPTLTAISPATTVAGTGQFTLTLTGTAFRPSTYATLNGTVLATAYVSGTQLTAIVPAASSASVGSYGVTVVTPAPGGGTSGAVTFTVSAPAGTGWTYTAAVPQWAVSGTNGVTATHNNVAAWHTVLGARAVSANTGVHYYELDSDLFQRTSYIMVGVAATTYMNPSPSGQTYFGSTGDREGYGLYWNQASWVATYTPATAVTTYLPTTTLDGAGTAGVQLDTASNTVTFYLNNLPIWRATFATMVYPVVPAIAVYGTPGSATLLTHPAGQHYPPRGGSAGWGNVACNAGFSWDGTSCVAARPMTTSVESLAFGSQRAGWPSASQTVGVTNSGLTSLTVSSVTVPTGFSQTNTCGTLAPAQSCFVTVTFIPPAAQAYSGDLTINNTSATPVKTVALTGTGFTQSGWLPNAAMPRWVVSGTDNAVATHASSLAAWDMVLGAKGVLANTGVHYFELNTNMMTSSAHVMLGVLSTSSQSPTQGQSHFGSPGMLGYGLFWNTSGWSAAYTPASSSTVYSSTMLAGVGCAGVRIDTATNTVELYLNDVLTWRAVFSSMLYPVVPAMTVWLAAGSATLVENAAAQQYPATGNNAGW